MLSHCRLALVIALLMALLVMIFPATLMADSPVIPFDNPNGPLIDVNGHIPGTGLREPTPSEIEWMKKNFPVIQEINLNPLALERINAERTVKGLNTISASSLNLVPLGKETRFSSSVEIDAVTTPGLTAILPGSVDNSALPAFPPIRSQGSIGSCATWATTYYQFTYETNLARGRTASNGDNNNIFSPKWTYNQINGGGDNGSYFSAAYAVEMKNGAARWTDFPYDSNYLEWPLNAATWREALKYRPLTWGQISNSDIGILIGNLKTHLANGHVICIATYVSSWAQMYVGNDPSTSDDNAFVGQKIAGYLKNTNQGGHGMTIVGYNDSLWCDLNGNGQVESAEKGAFKIANSWGTGDWNSGYRWVSYDALRPVSLVPSTGTWPATNRGSGIFWSGNYFTLTARDSYSPTMLAEVTLNHAARRQLSLSLGVSNTLSSTPTSTWTSGAVNYSGGNWAFNGTSAAVDGTFVLDFSDLAPAGNTVKRWFAGITDNTAGNPATLKSFKLIQAGSSGDTVVANYTGVPKSVDSALSYSWVDYPNGAPVNQPPKAVASASPTSGYAPLNATFNGSGSTDPDGSIVSYNWNFGDGYGSTSAIASHTYTTTRAFTATLTVTDDKGATNSTTLQISTVSSSINVPTRLTAAATTGYVRLNWKDNSNNETGFYIERSSLVNRVYSAFTQVGSVDANITTFSQPAAPGTYRYRVRAYNSVTRKVSPYSNTFTVKVR